MTKFNSQKGFVVPLVLAIVAILVAGAVYVAMKNTGSRTDAVSESANSQSESNTAPADVNPSTTSTKAMIAVVSPKIGDVLTPGKTYPIVWNSSNLGGQKLFIDLDKIVGSKLSLVKSLASNVTNTGNYSWTLDNSLISGDSYVVRVYTSDNIDGAYPTAGASSANFSIGQSISSNSDWKTYVNSQYGFTLTYPSQWGNPQTLLSGDVDFGGHLDIAHRSSVLISPEIGTPIAIIIDGKEGLEEWSSQLGTIVRIPLADSSALELDVASKPDDQTLKQIISSFKFTSAQAVTSNSDWKTYTDSQHGFSIEYPSSGTVADTDYGVSFTVAENNALYSTATFLINVDAQASQTACNNMQASMTPVTTSSAVINGITFVKGDASESATGQRFSSTQYCAFKNGIAYTLKPTIEYARDQAYSDGFNPAINVSNDAVLNMMLSTFKFTN